MNDALLVRSLALERLLAPSEQALRLLLDDNRVRHAAYNFASTPHAPEH